MRITCLFVFLAGAVVLFFLPSHGGKITKYHDSVERTASSVNPPAAKTGAPGETTCTSCHFGTAQAADGIVEVTFSGAGDEYIVGEPYTITISIATGTKNGFQMTILDSSDAKAGTFTAGTNSSLANSGGRQYIRQDVADDILSWSFTWTAPATDLGDLTMYYTFNKSNDASNTGGDVIYVGQKNLASAEFNTITSYEKEDAGYSVFYNSAIGELNLGYVLGHESKVVVSIRNIAGGLVNQVDLGHQPAGAYTEKLLFDNNAPAGIYVVSLFVNNNVYNRKIAVQ